MPYVCCKGTLARRPHVLLRGAPDVVGGTFKSKVIKSGTFKHRFASKGRFQYVCTLHRGMTGTIRVR